MSRATRWILLALAIALLGAIVYHPVRHFGFLNLDDNQFVHGNPQLEHGLTAQSLTWAFHANLDYYSKTAEYWAPLTLLTRILDAQFYGPNAAGAFHLTSLAFHLLNTLLLAFACYTLTGHWPRSAVIALLFLVHPQNIEPVCWLSARKDLVSATFFLVTLIAYAHYVRRQNLARYGLLVLAFVCCLMSKPMGVSIPLVLLTLDFWPLQRLHSGPGALRENFRIVSEKIPLLILAGLASGLAVVSQQDWNALAVGAEYPFPVRAGNAVFAYFTYLRRLFWPSDLCIYYPHPGLTLRWPPVIAAGLVMAALSVAVWCLRRRQPWLLAGWLWFGLTLGPVIGLVQIGGQAMADRYAYPATIGLLIALVWLIAERLPARIAIALAAIAIALFTAAAIPQVRTWHDSITVFHRALDVTTANGLAHLNLGDALADAGDIRGARAEFQRALEIRPQSALIWNNLARTEVLLGDDVAAVQAYQESLRCDPNQQMPLLFLGRLFKKQERWEAAEKLFVHLREVAPDLPQPYRELGEVYAAQKRYPEARQAWWHYLEFHPEDQAIRQRREALPHE